MHFFNSSEVVYVDPCFLNKEPKSVLTNSLLNDKCDANILFFKNPYD